MRVPVFLLLILFSLPAFNLQSEDKDRIWAPFHGGIVDPAIIQSMLQAGEEGRLYLIQQNSSRVRFCVNSIIGRVEARFKGIQGGLALRKYAWGDRSQMLAMVDTNSVEMERDYLKNMLISEYFLDTHNYPKILFVSTKLWWLRHDHAIVEGMLTMHGVTKPVYFDVKMSPLANNNPQNLADIIVTAKAFINRSDFGMANLTPLVSDSVELCLHIEATLFKK